MDSNDTIYETLPVVLTVAELSKTMKIGINAAYGLVSSGALRSVRIGKTIRIPRSALLEYLDGKTIGEEAEIP